MIKKLVQNYKSKSCFASNPSHNDVYIVEYPKSGITWLSNIIANLSLLESNRNEVANFCSGLFYIPDIHISRNIGPMPYNNPSVRFIKSHDIYNPYYNFVIYLVRHPFNVMKSYYRHIIQRNPKLNITFISFLKNKNHGILKWKEHINSWLTGGHTSQRIHLLRYEDLVKDTQFYIDELYKNFGWHCNESNLTKAIEISSIKNMKNSELVFKKNNPRYKALSVKENFEFQNLDDGEKYIMKNCEKELKLLGYL